MKKYNCNVIVCAPAVGKTYLAQHDDRFVDVDGMKAKYKYNLYSLSDEELERGKFNRGEEVRKDSSLYAIKILEETIKNDKIALLSFHKKIIDYIVENNIDYCLVYADYSLREEYKKRMEDRGNCETFIYEMTNENDWKKFYEENDNDPKPTYKIKLKSGEYLSDIKDYFL